MSTPQATGFAALPKLDLTAERQKIDLKLVRERLDSCETSKASRLDAVIHPDTGKILGTVSVDRPRLSFGEIMDFLTGQLDLAGVQYRLKDNVVTEKGELYQTYVFDRGYKGPDGELIDPMIIARANYLNNPLSLDFGDYRFVCRNGVTLGTTIGRIKIGTKQATSLARLALRDQFSLAFDRFETVGARYKDMAEVTLTDAMHAFVRDEHVPKGMKKGAIETLAQQGYVEIDDAEGKVRTRLLDEEPDAIYKIRKEGTKWDLRQALTWRATHESNSLGAMTKSYAVISHYFGV